MPRFADSLRPSYTELWRSNRLLWVVCALLVGGSLALFLVDLHAREKAALEYTKRFSQNFADVLAEHAARTFEAVERTLRAAEGIRAQRAAQLIAEKAVKPALQSLRSGAPAILAVGWTDASGNVVAHSYDGAAVRPNISDLPHFKALQQSGQDGLYIGSLYRSKATDAWISAAAIRLEDADGHFAGVVSAPLNLAYFSGIFRAIKLGQNDAVAILRLDGTLLFREPFVEPSLATTKFAAPSFFSQNIRGKASGAFETVSPIDGRPRLYAFRTVENDGLIVVVAQDRADALAAVSRHFWTFGPLVLIFATVILIGTWLLARKNSLHVRQTGLLKATLENMHEGLMVVDGDSRIAVCNQKAVALLGVPPALVQGHPPVENVIDYLTAQGEFDGVSGDIVARLKPEISSEKEYVYERRRPNGMLLEVRTVPFAEGGVVRTYNDVSEQRRIEGELNRNERQFRLLAENATDIIARIDLEGMLHYISPSCLPIVGYSPAEMVCTNIADYIHSDDLPATMEALAAIAAGETRPERKIEYRLRHKDGRLLWLEANPTLVFNDAGIPFELVDVMRDITDRKRMETEAALAKRQAEQAARAKGEFLATMSHELRTPLNSIIGFASILLERQKLDGETRRQVGLIQTASDGLLAIVNDVLDFSQIEEGRLTITPSRFVLSELIEGSVAIVRDAANAKGLDLTAAFSESDDAELVGDSQRLRQILLNFLNNAIKFTRHGFVRLDVTRLRRTRDRLGLRFAVTDSGIGIPPEKSDRLFQRFSQVDGSINREFGGSGLGLAICKRLTELMGGEIGFASTAGSGSCFWFEIELPLAAASSAADEPPTPVQLISSEPARILLVEDLPINSEIATALLTARGYVVDAVFDGAEAVAAVQRMSYALVLMDVQMPGMDGITATQLIRQLPSAVSKVPIIAMTANVLPEQVRHLEEIGMDGHIGKPFQVDHLVEIVERHRRTDLELPADSKSQDMKADSLLAPGQLEALNAMLAERLRTFAREARGYDRSALAAHAHKMTSATGFLGLAELSRTFADVERLAPDDGVSDVLLRDLIAASLAAAEAIAGRRKKAVG